MSESHRFPSGSRRGWLRSDALRNGHAEQHAVMVGRVRHVVELRFDRGRGGFVTTYKIDDPSAYVIECHEWQVAENLPLAREKFAGYVERVRALTPVQS